MPDQSANWDLLSTWQDQLNSYLDQKANIVGAPNFSFGGMSADQKSALEGLENGISECRRMIIQLGGDGTSKTNRRAVPADGSLY